MIVSKVLLKDLIAYHLKQENGLNEVLELTQNAMMKHERSLYLEDANRLVLEKGLSFREAYHLIKTDPELVNNLHWKQMMESYTHLGSPGNPGLGQLKGLL